MVVRGRQVQATLSANNAPIFIMPVLIANPGVKQQIADKDIPCLFYAIYRDIRARRMQLIFMIIEVGKNAGHRMTTLLIKTQVLRVLRRCSTTADQLVPVDQYGRTRDKQWRQHTEAITPPCKLIGSVGNSHQLGKFRGEFFRPILTGSRASFLKKGTSPQGVIVPKLELGPHLLREFSSAGWNFIHGEHVSDESPGTLNVTRRRRSGADQPLRPLTGPIKAEATQKR